MRWAVVSLLTVGMSLGALGAARADERGVPVGQSAPSFSLQDQGGETRSLASFHAAGPVAIIFFRSADW